MKSERFYHLAGFDSYSEREGPPYPWTIDVNLREDMEEQLLQGARLDRDVMPNIGIANRVAPWSDFAATNLSTIVVSDRAKQFIEEHAPGDAQFVRLRVKTIKGRPIESPTFWVANCLRVLDCVDKRKSATDVVCGDIVYKWVYIAPSKVPSGVSLFRCRDDRHRLLVRGSFARHLKRSGLTGAEFFATGRPGEETVDL